MIFWQELTGGFFAEKYSFNRLISVKGKDLKTLRTEFPKDTWFKKELE